MNQTKIRIKNIMLSNIKNVANGTVMLNDFDKDTFGASIVGLYGQNGSGKTALIWALGIVKDAMSGAELPKDTYFYIRRQSSVATIKVDLLVTIEGREYNVYYTLSIGKKGNKEVQILSESVEFSSQVFGDMPQIFKTRILGIDYPESSDEIDECFYNPTSRIDEITLKDKQIKQKLLVLQALANEKVTS